MGGDEMKLSNKIGDAMDEEVHHCSHEIITSGEGDQNQK